MWLATVMSSEGAAGAVVALGNAATAAAGDAAGEAAGEGDGDRTVVASGRPVGEAMFAVGKAVGLSGVGISSVGVAGAAEVVSLRCSALANSTPPACPTAPIAPRTITPANTRRRTLLALQRIERGLDFGVVAGGRLACGGQRRTQLVRARIVHTLQCGRGFDGLAVDCIAAFADFVRRLM